MSGIYAIAHYVKMRTAMPLKGLGGSVHHIHASTEYDAKLMFSDLQDVVNAHAALVKKLEEIHDITQDTTSGVECWQKLQNIAATAAAALDSVKGHSK